MGSILFVLPETVTGQQSEREQITGRAIEAGIEQQLMDRLFERSEKHDSEEIVLSILHSATSMAENNLPYELIFNKAFEGLTKGVPSGLIENTITGIEQSTRQAAEVVDPWLQEEHNLPFDPRDEQSFRDGLVVAISNVMRNEVSADAAGNILRALSNASLPADVGPAKIIAAVRIIPDMTSFTGQSDRALGFVLHLVDKGFKAGEMLKLPTAMRYFQGRNNLPASVMVEAITGRLQDLPASRIMQDLMTNNRNLIEQQLPSRNKIAI